MRRSRGMLVAILVVAALMAAPLSVAADTNTYTVVSGDTLSRIAARLGVASYMEIVELTNATHATDPSFAFIENPNLIRVGWKLAIPGAAPAEVPGPTQSALVATAQQTDVGVSQVSNLESLGILGLVMPSEAELARLPQSTVDLLTAQVPAMYGTMVDSLKNQSAFTMFIPSGSAWMRLSDAQLQTLASDAPLRTSTWLNHVVPSKVMAADLVDGQTLTTLGGQTLTVTRTGDQVSINGRPLLRTDVQPPSGQIASRGIVHVVDGILSAEALGGQANDYVVVAGDTLFKIAAQLLGDGHRYPEIVALTNSAGPGYATIQNPNVIGVGWKLAIPAR